MKHRQEQGSPDLTPNKDSTSRQFRAIPALLLGAALLLAMPANAQPQASEAPPSYDAAFKAMMADPGNLDKTFTFADAAIRAGDLEGAVAALERMLFVNPNLPRVRLELGTLYFRLGSFETARSYFQSIKDQPDAPAAVTNKVDGFLAEIDKRQSPHKWSGSVLSGVRWQSNANTASASGDVQIQGIAASLDSQFTQKKDWNAFVAANAKHVYELNALNSDTWDSTVTSYVARQAAQKTVDVSYVEITTGPSLKIFPGNNYDLTLRPYGMLTYVAVDDVRDYFAPGYGISLNATLNANTMAEIAVEMRDRRFRDSFKSPSKSNRDGIEQLIRGRLTYAINQDWSVNIGGSVTQQDAKSDPQSNMEYAVTVGAAWSYDSPFSAADPRWALIASVTRAFTSYDQPDSTVNSEITRFDRDWRFSLTQAIPISQSWTLVATLARTLRGSSLPNNQYTNNSAMFGASFRF